MKGVPKIDRWWVRLLVSPFVALAVIFSSMIMVIVIPWWILRGAEETPQ